MKKLLVLAAIGAMGYFGWQQLDIDLGDRDGPVTPSVGYHVPDDDGGVGSVGEGTSGLLGD